MDKPTKGIVVDGSTRGNPGPSQYRAIDLETGKELFNLKIGVATNNITEFIALAHAVLLCESQKLTVDIYSDSVTAMSWLKNKKSNSSLRPGRHTDKAIEYISRIEKALKDIKIQEINHCQLLIGRSITVLKWFTSEWGEIPADFSRK